MDDSHERFTWIILCEWFMIQNDVFIKLADDVFCLAFGRRTVCPYRFRDMLRIKRSVQAMFSQAPRYVGISLWKVAHEQIWQIWQHSSHQKIWWAKRAPGLDGGPLQCNWHCCWDRCSAQVESVEVHFGFEGFMDGKAINEYMNGRSGLPFIDPITLE